MQQSGLNRHARSSSRGSAARNTRSASGALAVTTIVGLFALTGVGCDDEDIIRNQGGSGGSGGSRAGTGGSAGGGSGGASGSGGTSGSGGSGGTDGDAGVTDAGGDAASGALTRQQMAEAICESFAAVPDCTPPDDCVNEQLAGWAFLDTLAPECTDVIDAYNGCVAASAQSAFICLEGAPGTAPGTCAAEEDEMNSSLGSAECCPDCL